MASNVELVKELYAKFGAGNFEGFVEQLTDDVICHVCPGTPYGGQKVGKDQVMAWLKETSRIAWNAFHPTLFLSEGDEVVCFVHMAGTVVETGKSLDIEAVHRMRLADGKVVFFREWLSDSREVAAAFQA